MAQVHEVHEVRRRPHIWPAVVMLLVVLLLIGLIAAMMMNVRGSISWPAGGVEFGFRPHPFVTTTDGVTVISPPTTLATNVAPEADTAQPVPAPAESTAP